MKKSIFSVILCFAMIISLLPFVAVAEDNLTPAVKTENGLVLSKNLVPQENGNGSYDLKLEAYAEGKLESGEEIRNTEFDISLVIDQSGSMATTDIGGSWNEVDGPWTIERATSGKTYYTLVNGKYYPVHAGTGPIYYKVPDNQKPYAYKTFGAGHDNTVLDDGIGSISAKIHYNVPNKYYVYDSVNKKMHKMYIMTIGVFAAYEAYAYYYTDEANPWNNGDEGTKDISYLSAQSWDMGQIMKCKDWAKFQEYGGTRKQNTAFGVPIPGSYTYTDGPYAAWHDGVLGIAAYDGWYEWMDMCRDGVVRVAGRNDATISDWNAMRARYTWFSNGDPFKNDMYLPKNGTTYNHLYYIDDNGNQQPVGEEAVFDGDTVYSGKLYEKVEGDSRLSALQDALHLFTYTVAQDAKKRDVHHNISMVGFASNKADNYTNTGLFVGEQFKKYDTISQSDYENAYVDLTANDTNDNGVNQTIDNNIDNLQANGYTYTSYGMAMANQIFANNDNDNGKRQRIIVVFTDGEPGRNGYERTAAGEAIADAEIAKDLYGAKVYTIGLYTGNVEQQITDFMTELTSSKEFVETNVYASDTAGSNYYCGQLNPSETYLYTDNDEGKTYAVTAVQNGAPSLGWWSESIAADGESYIPKATSDDSRSYVTQFYNANGSAFYSGDSNDPVKNLNYSATYYTSDGKPIRYGYRWYNTDGDVVIPKTDANSDGEQFFQISNPSERDQGQYYFPVTDANGIQSAFDAVTTYIAPVVNIVSATELGASATLKDILSDSFDIALTNGQPEITVQTAKGTANATGEIKWADPVDSELEADYSDGAITLTGFNYKTNFIAYGKEAIENDTEANQGRKVIVTIKGLTPKDDAIGTVYSNTENSGIYDGTEIKAKFPRPNIDIGAPSAFVIDYSAPIKLATMTKQMKGESHNNGTFNLSNEIVSYQLATDSQADKKAVINGVYRDVDSAMVYGKPEGNNSVAWNKLITVPSSSVYFDDNLTSTITSDGYGKSSEVDDQTVSKSAGSVDGTFYFTFYGTGIDVYCTTHDKGGYVSAALFRASQESECVKANREGTAKMIQNYSSENYYNTPSVSFTGLPAGTYTLKIMATEDVQYKLDGIRVYNPVETGSDAANELNKTEDGNATYLNLRKVLLNDKGIGGFTVTNSILDGDIDPSTVSGVLFIDDVGKIKTTSNIDKDGNISETPINLYQSQFDVYKNNGPKNEIYLKNGQAVTFRVNTEKVSADKTIYIGLSAPKTGSGSVSVNENDSIMVGSVMDMYYPITVPATGSITITNDGNSLISITNLKITGIADLIPAATQENQAETLNATRALFKPVTMKAVRMAANNGVDPEEETVEPEQPIETEKPNVTEEPTETEKPSVTEEPAEPENPGEGSLVIDEPEETETPAPTPSVEPEKPATTGNTIQKLIQSITKSISNFFKSIFRR